MRPGQPPAQDIGLRIALEELCGEMARQDDAAIVASADPYAQDARTFEAASSALL